MAGREAMGGSFPEVGGSGDASASAAVVFSVSVDFETSGESGGATPVSVGIDCCIGDSGSRSCWSGANGLCSLGSKKMLSCPASSRNRMVEYLLASSRSLMRSRRNVPTEVRKIPVDREPVLDAIDGSREMFR